MAHVEYVRHYVQSILPIFRLDQWDVRVADWTPSPEDEEEGETKAKELLAYIIVEDESRGASIKLYPKFYEESLAVQQQAIAHELCHCIVAQYTVDVEPLLALIKNEQAREIVTNLLCRREELLTDEIACVILPRLPAYSPPL